MMKSLNLKSKDTKSTNELDTLRAYIERRGVSRVVKARFNRLTRVSNVEPFAYEDE